MKRYVCFILLIAILIFVSSYPISAHGGDTDSSGGHYDHSTGEYHYHHGYPDHQHPNGRCPYNYDDKTGQNSGGSSNGSSSGGGSSNSGSSADWGALFGVFALFGIIAFIVFVYKDTRPQPPKASSEPKETASEQPPTPESPKESPQPSNPSDSTQEHHKEPSYSNQQNDSHSNYSSHSSQEHKTSYSNTPAASRSYDYSRKTPNSPPPYNRVPATPYIPNTKADNEPIDVEQILKDNPLVLDIDPDFFNKSQLDLYLESIKTSRAKKAVTEYLAVDRLTIDKDSTPITVDCVVYSESFNEYRTSLTKCTCPDHQTRHVVCKHMLGLAIKVGAIMLDTDKICSNKK